MKKDRVLAKAATRSDPIRSDDEDRLCGFDQRIVT